MVYIISGIAIAICIAVIIWGLKILRENRELLASKKKENKKENKSLF